MTKGELDKDRIDQAARGQGWRVERTRKGEKWFSPDKVTIVTWHSTPSDRRGFGSTWQPCDEAGWTTCPAGRVVEMTEFTVTIETIGPRPEDGLLGELGPVLEDVGALGPAASAGGLGGGPGATFTVEEEGWDRAVRRGYELFVQACKKLGLGYEVAHIDVMGEEYFERWLTRPAEEYSGLAEVAELLAVSKQRVAELRERPGFPAPVAELASGPVWKTANLRVFLDSWERKPGRPRQHAGDHEALAGRKPSQP